MPRRIQVIINPASGKPQPILHVLNQVFHDAKMDWDVSLTHQNGDAERFARQASEAGADVVAAFGGDGTVMEVARGLFGTVTPLAILPGGTANLMSVELGIPRDLAEAAKIAADPESPVRHIDAGTLGEKTFLLRVGMGFAAEKVIQADRSLKNRWGLLAYTIGGIKALKASHIAHYRLTMDRKTFEFDSLSCQVYNAGNMGTSGVNAAKNIDVSDGLLDVLALRETAGTGLIKREIDLVNSGVEELFYHWQARQLVIETEPALPVQVDGETGWNTPLNIQVLPGAVAVLTAATLGN